MKKKQLTIMLGAMTLALLLGTAPVVQNVAAAGLPVSISQKQSRMHWSMLILLTV